MDTSEAIQSIGFLELAGLKFVTKPSFSSPLPSSSFERSDCVGVNEQKSACRGCRDWQKKRDTNPDICKSMHICQKWSPAHIFNIQLNLLG